jgi:hypothetical protein
MSIKSGNYIKVLHGQYPHNTLKVIKFKLEGQSSVNVGMSCTWATDIRLFQSSVGHMAQASGCKAEHCCPHHQSKAGAYSAK